MFPESPVKGLDSLYIFPYYQTREAFEQATGRPCPAWNPNLPPKYWYDPKAAESTRRNVVFDNTLVYSLDGTILQDTAGRPTLDVLVLPKEQAASVNIPDKKLGAANIPGADRPEVPVPLRVPGEDEEIFFIFGQTVAVRSKTAWAQTQNVFTAADRAMLKKIAEKVGVAA